MANEKRLIDVNPLMKDGWHLVKTGKSNVFIASMSLADVQTVEAVEVVRCKDCRKRHTWECAMHYESDDGKEQYGWENDNDFCSWGERKDGDGNG